MIVNVFSIQILTDITKVYKKCYGFEDHNKIIECHYMAIRVNRRWAALGKDPQYP